MLRKCPFCGGEVTTDGVVPDFHYHKGMKKWMIVHACLHSEEFEDGVSILITGEKQDVIDKWNGVYEKQTSKSL